MEGVGARFGRSSTRYGGPATVFTGPVRKWKKKWSPVTNNKHPQNTNGTTSCLLLYKWTPYDVNVSDSKKTKAELPRRRFKYIPVIFAPAHQIIFSYTCMLVVIEIIC